MEITELTEIDSLTKYYEFVDGRIRELLPRVSNCIGSGLFAVGERKFDSVIFNNPADKLINNLKVVDNPVRYGLVAWESPFPEKVRKELGLEQYFHLGIVMDEDPVRITYRNMVKGTVMHGRPLEEVNKDFLCRSRRFGCSKTKYFLPGILEKLL